jgi:hypothetical protein
MKEGTSRGQMLKIRDADTVLEPRGQTKDTRSLGTPRPNGEQ